MAGLRSIVDSDIRTVVALVAVVHAAAMLRIVHFVSEAEADRPQR